MKMKTYLIAAACLAGVIERECMAIVAELAAVMATPAHPSYFVTSCAPDLRAQLLMQELARRDQDRQARK